MEQKFEKKSHNVSPIQEIALTLILQGRSDADAANEIGVPLEQFLQWRRYNPIFAAALNRRRRLLWENSLDQMRALIPQCMQTLQNVMNERTNANRWRAAVELLKLSGISPESSHDLGRMVGPDNPTEMAERIKLL